MQRSSTAQPPSVHATHVSAPEQGSRTSGRLSKPLRFGAVAILAVILLAAGLVTWYEVGHSDRIYNGVRVLGNDLSGMTRDEATTALTAATVGYPLDSVQVSGQGHTWMVPAGEMGVGVDVAKTLDAAISVGRSGNLIDDLGTQLNAFFKGSETTAVLKQDAAAIDKVVARIAADVDKPA